MTSARHVLLLSLSVAAAWSLCGPPRTGCDGIAEAIEAGAPAPPTPDELRAALMSVYYYAYYVRDGKEPTLPGRPMPLADAAKILQRDTTFGSGSRRRRAIGKLGAAYRLLVSGGADPHKIPVTAGDLYAALGILGAPPSMFPRPGAGRGGGGPCAPKSFTDLEKDVYQQLDAQPRVTYERQCCSCIMSCDTFEQKNSSRVRFTIQVDRDLDGLKVVADPQKWAECNPLYFKDTHYAGGDCPSAMQGGPVSPAPQPGSSWSGVLFEHFATALGVDLTNLININDQPATGRLFNFSLCQAIKGTDILTKDCGFSSVLKDPATSGQFKSQVRGLKIVDFKNLSPGTISMEAMVDEMAQVAVCCQHPTAPCPCATETCRLANGDGSVQNAPCPP
jgi:hypothetical protein